MPAQGRLPRLLRGARGGGRQSASSAPDQRRPGSPNVEAGRMDLEVSAFHLPTTIDHAPRPRARARRPMGNHPRQAPSRHHALRAVGTDTAANIASGRPARAAAIISSAPARSSPTRASFCASVGGDERGQIGRRPKREQDRAGQRGFRTAHRKLEVGVRVAAPGGPRAGRPPREETDVDYARMAQGGPTAPPIPISYAPGRSSEWSALRLTF